MTSCIYPVESSLPTRPQITPSPLVSLKHHLLSTPPLSMHPTKSPCYTSYYHTLLPHSMNANFSRFVSLVLFLRLAIILHHVTIPHIIPPCHDTTDYSFITMQSKSRYRLAVSFTTNSSHGFSVPLCTANCVGARRDKCWFPWRRMGSSMDGTPTSPPRSSKSLAIPI